MSDEWSFIHQIRQGALLRVSFKEYCINCIQFSRMIIAIVRISVSVSLLITKLLQWSSPLRCSSLGSGAWQSCRMQTNAFVDFLFACSCTAVGLMDCEALASSSNFHQKNDLPHATYRTSLFIPNLSHTLPRLTPWLPTQARAPFHPPWHRLWRWGSGILKSNVSEMYAALHTWIKKGKKTLQRSCWSLIWSYTNMYIPRSIYNIYTAYHCMYY